MHIGSCVLASIAFAFSSANLPAAAQSPAELGAELVEMGAADQAVREKLGPFLASGNFQSDAFKALAQEMASIDAGNLKKLSQIVARSGWPDMAVVGSDASNSAFLILQHSPHETQQELLPIFREAVRAGKARRDHLAMLEDRILAKAGKKQLYGTQITAGPDGNPRVNPIEDPENLNVRRAAVGLPPMDEYLDRMEAQIGRKIDRSTLTTGAPEPLPQAAQ